jgi:uncharacterized RDD family membrane protein YckC
VVVFETPEQTRLELTLAPFGTRIMAACADAGVALAITAFLLFVAILVGVALGMLTGSGAIGPLAGAAVASFLLTNAAVHVWGEVRGEGQTWGKRLTGIRTVMATGQGVTLGAALIRGLALVVDWIPLLWLLPTMSAGSRRAGDFLAGTFVVQVRRRGRGAGAARIDWPAATYAELSERSFYFGEEQARRLYRDDLNLVEYGLVRVQAAPPRRRKKLLQALVRPYLERLALEDEGAREAALGDPRRFLHELGLFLKERFEGRAF